MTCLAQPDNCWITTCSRNISPMRPAYRSKSAAAALESPINGRRSVSLTGPRARLVPSLKSITATIVGKIVEDGFLPSKKDSQAEVIPVCKSSSEARGRLFNYDVRYA